MSHIRYCVYSDKKSILKELTDLLSCDSNFQAFRDVLDKVIVQIIN